MTRYTTTGNARPWQSAGYRDRPRIAGGWQTRSVWPRVVGEAALVAATGLAFTLFVVALS